MKTSKRKSTTGSMLVDLAGRTLLVAAACALFGAGTVNAQLSFDANDTSQFGSWAKIDQAGNAGETHDYNHGGVLTFGGVDYDYHIGKHAVSIADWQAMVDDGHSIGGNYDAWNDGTEGNLGTDVPAVNISMNDAAAYANWLTSGDPATGAYTLDGGGAVTAIDRSYRNADGMLYVLTNEDEWYKAAYYSLDESSVGSEVYYDYIDGSDTVPKTGDAASDEWNIDNVLNNPRDVGRYGLEQNGTHNMGGNVFEWIEDTEGVIRGGAYNWGNTTPLGSGYRVSDGRSPTDEVETRGFRVAAIPEPASGALFVLLGGLLWFVRRKLRA